MQEDSRTGENYLVTKKYETEEELFEDQLGWHDEEEDMWYDGFICNNIYEELKNYQPTTKKSDWDHKFGAIINNLYAKYRKAA